MDAMVLILIISGILCGGIANGAFFWMQKKLIDAGEASPKSLFSIFDLLQISSTYGKYSKARGVSRLPPLIFWAALLVGLLLFIATAVRMQSIQK